MRTGDEVVVRNVDGEAAEGEIVGILAERTADYEIDFLEAEDATLLDYWRGADVDPDAPVVQVALGTGVYDYPADRIEVLEDA